MCFLLLLPFPCVKSDRSLRASPLLPFLCVVLCPFTGADLVGVRGTAAAPFPLSDLLVENLGSIDTRLGFHSSKTIFPPGACMRAFAGAAAPPPSVRPALSPKVFFCPRLFFCFIVKSLALCVGLFCHTTEISHYAYARFLCRFSLFSLFSLYVCVLVVPVERLTRPPSPLGSSRNLISCVIYACHTQFFWGS